MYTSRPTEVLKLMAFWCVLSVVAAQPTNLGGGGTEQSSSNNEYGYVSSWPILDRKLGSVSAVAIDGATGSVVIFHRGSHVWGAASFDLDDNFLNATGGPITQHTVLAFNRTTGSLLQEWGENIFYMPHGLTIDHERNYWLTDVALHQVFKFNVTRSTKEPVLALGERFQHGNDLYHFCKPTSVAVLPSGEFFVADGYCNGRIVKYTPDGTPILSWGRNSFVLTRQFNLPDGPVPESYFAIPHALTLVPDRALLCVADREQGRVQCFHTANGTFHSQFSDSEIGTRLFSVKYVAQDGGLLYIINGPQFTLDRRPIIGTILAMGSGRLVGHFRPDNMGHAFSNPHELAVTDDGAEVYVAELDPQLVHKFRRLTTPTIVTLPTTVEARQEEQASSAALQTQVKPEQTIRSPSADVTSSALTVGTIGVFSIVSTLLVTSFLVMLLSRVICFRNGPDRTDEVALQNMNEEI
ncbi:peptidyl-alpha-hydroxyglycine alpha-amidating lyase 1 [Anopheles cruzii]|uniref:peptidyl-alpha-hydroxyglycine alpha-amidating lyase 1 n=1 Tax=Anopheles cruzii TaxID=68878 RepID=UPI0022EC5FE2|nr:peptidyl-alpha-hydroxyglycine alpha-amidating lyase 1 [Anopheles cruzii]